jgi:hypothetical protein
MNKLEIKISDKFQFNPIPSKVEPKPQSKVKNQSSKLEKIEFRSMVVPEKKL